MKIKLPHSTQNWTTVIGATIALISFFMIIFLFTISVLAKQSHSYLGLIIFIILPAFLLGGLILIPIGMFFKIRKDKKTDFKQKFDWPEINLNDVRNRNAFFIFAIGTTIFLFLSAFGSYESYNYTESVQFCGTTCHTVMKPEYVAYQSSPHARVACVECHVGSGASWYVKSKLSGLHQVYAVTFDTYPKPIPVPIKNLRPALATCEECHWPQKFYARKLKIEKHYLPTKTNKEWDIYLLLKIGAEHSAMGLKEGIHWHINRDVRIQYVATDSHRQVIPWVRYTNLNTGKSKVFIDQDADFDTTKLGSLSIRTMDCIDCHNRPAHNFRSPMLFVNNALTAGVIPKQLPDIKSVAMDICSNNFNTTDSAMLYIKNKITNYYKENYPKVKPQLVSKAITGLQKEFKKNIFPEMKSNWSDYPNNIGHLEFNGCFRCHNGSHVSKTGEKIPNNCNLCHDIMAQGPPDSLQTVAITGKLEFKHPVDIDQAWKDTPCNECHTGLNP